MTADSRPETMVHPFHPRSAGELLDTAWHLVRQHWRALVWLGGWPAGVAIGWTALSEGLSGGVATGAVRFVGFLIHMSAFGLAEAALVVAASDVLHGRLIVHADVWRRVLPRTRDSGARAHSH